MARELSIEETEKKARELLDGRMASVRSLVESRQAVADLQAKVAEAETEDGRRYGAALAEGWSADELRKLGLASTVTKARTKRPPRGRATTAASDEIRESITASDE